MIGKRFSCGDAGRGERRGALSPGRTSKCGANIPAAIAKALALLVGSHEDAGGTASGASRSDALARPQAQSP